MYQLADDVH